MGWALMTRSLLLRKTAFPAQALAGFLEPPRPEDPGPVQELLSQHHTPILGKASEKLIAPHGLLFPHLPLTTPLR